MSEENIHIDTLVTEDMTKKELFEYAKYLEYRKEELLNINSYLQEKYESLIDVGAKHLQNEILYKSRCEKAIARIKLLGKYNGEYCTRNFKMMSADFNDLLNILQGSDKE